MELVERDGTADAYVLDLVTRLDRGQPGRVTVHDLLARAGTRDRQNVLVVSGPLGAVRFLHGQAHDHDAVVDGRDDAHAEHCRGALRLWRGVYRGLVRGIGGGGRVDVGADQSDVLGDIGRAKHLLDRVEVVRRQRVGR